MEQAEGSRGGEGDARRATRARVASLEARARAEEASAAAREAEERERAERETIVAALVADRIERITRAERRRRMEARAAVRAILDEYVVVPAVATVEEPDLKRRIAILRAKNEALRARLAWERKLEFTPRAVLRRKPFGPEEVAIIRSIEPALAVRTVKDPSYDPFKNGYDLSWMRPDWKPPGLDENEDDAKVGRGAAVAETAEREGDDEPRAEKAGAFSPAPPIAIGHVAADVRASSAYAPEQHRHSKQRQTASETRRSPPSTSPRPPRASAATRRLARLAAKRSPPDAVRSPAEDGLGFIDALDRRRGGRRGEGGRRNGYARGGDGRVEAHRRRRESRRGRRVASIAASGAVAVRIAVRGASEASEEESGVTRRKRCVVTPVGNIA